MTKLEDYLQDGANAQARATLMFLQSYGTVEDSWNKEYHKYDAEIKVARWENCREQGYITSLRTKDYSKQLNIAFFEHRNSDAICAVKWEQSSMNTLTIENAEFSDVYTDKFDVSHRVEWGQAKDMAEWISDQFTSFWNENTAKDEN